MSTAVRAARIGRSRRRIVRVVRLLAGALAVLLLLALPAGPAGADELTASHDSTRTGWDAAEPGLAPSAVSSSDFGQLFSTPVDGQVYAQPLVANGMLIAATENNTIYGLDPATGTQKWSRNLGPAWPAATLNCGDLTPTIGITSTPVYDPNTGAVYLTSKVNDGPDAQHPHWYLHAVDPGTGAERAGFPVSIQGAPSNNPAVPFLPETAMQRPALLLVDGVVYLGFGSHCDATPYVGYVVGVNSSTGKQTAMWATEANSSDEAGIWQSGGGLASDGSGRIFTVTGNGVAPAPGNGDTPPPTLGESVVRLGVNTDGSLSAQSFFSPANNAKLNQDDADLGSGGPMALPASFGTASHPHLLVVVGKSGQLYLLDADHLGGTGQGPNGGDLVVGTAGPFKGVWGHPGFWGGDGGWVYTVENGGPLRAYAYTNNAGTPGLVSTGTSTGTFPYGSGSPVVTSDGTTSGSALVWVVSTDVGTNGQLRAYDPVPQNGVLNQRYALPLGKTAKFTVPATDSGRVYVGTYDGHVIGVGRPTTSPLTTAPYDFGQVAVGSPGNGTVTVTATRGVTINSVATTAPFTATSPSAPVTLAQGQTFSVPAGFNPTTWGSVTKSLTFTLSDGTTTALDLHGTGTQPGLGASPSSLDFGQVRTGASKQLGVNVVNTGTTAETITGVTAPSAPYTIANAPAPQTPLAAGASTTISVTYTPTTGSDTGIANNDTLVVSSDQGNVTVPITGTALTGQPHLTLTPTNLDFGIVPVGQSVTKTFQVSNTGTVPLTITKAKAPAGSFTAATPLAEGQQIAPGDSITQSVTYTASTAWPERAQYEVTGDDGQSAQYVSLGGNLDPIGTYYQQLGGSRGSYLSDPVSAEYDIGATATSGPTGRGQDFRGGSIYWSPASGAHAMGGAILAHFKALGGPTSQLGYPTTDELGTPDGVGRYNHFTGNGMPASIYWTPNTGAQAIGGGIQAEWASTGWERGPLGYPTTDELGTPDGVGRYNHFTGQGGWAASVYWTPNTGAHEVLGAIHAEWAATGWEQGPLGYPTTDETITPDGVGHYNHFTGTGGNPASVYWTPNTGAHDVLGAIHAEWAATGWERGPLGYPTTDESGTPDGVGRYNHFTGQGGWAASIYWTPGTGAHEVLGAIRARWAQLGWERSGVGYPTSDEFGVNGGRRSNFAHGALTWLAADGSVQVAYY